MHNQEHAQAFKDERMERMTGRPSMPNVPPVRDPRIDGYKDPKTQGEMNTLMQADEIEGATLGPRPSAYEQAAGPGMLPR